MNQEFVFDCRFSYASGFELEIAFEFEFDFDFEFDSKPAEHPNPPTHAVAIAGPSGSGKTTILSLIAGILTPQDGTIRVGERTFFCSKSKTNVQPWKRRVGLLFQHDALFPHLSVEKNLRFGSPKTVTDTAPAWRFDELVHVLQLEPFLKRRPASLSGGQKQRVALGRTLLSDPEILLLDEPLNAVEATLRNSILNFVKALAIENSVPTILVSHNADVVAEVTDRVLNVRRGKAVSGLN